MKTPRIFTIALLLLGLVSGTFAQNVSHNAPANNAGKYGLQSWAVNNQRVASVFNYDVPSIWSRGLGAYTFPQWVCTSFYSLSGRTSSPWNTNATVTIVDGNSANTETVALNSATVSGGYCTISLNTANSHTGSYDLQSGSCGLKEALNDLQGAGGEVIVDQGFYDAGCTQATITGLTLANGLLANQYIHDISAGQDTWYGLKPTTLSLISAAGAALTLTGSAGGSLTNSGTYYVNYEYVDPVGGIGLPNTESNQITLSSQNTVTTSVPAASTGAVGWIPLITASGGSTNTEIEVPITAAVCTISKKVKAKTVCDMASAATITANPSATAKEVVESTGHTTFAYQPLSGPPSVGSSASQGMFQTVFGPFVAGATLNNSNEDLAQAFIPAGYFNYLGKSWDVCLKGATATQVASSVLALKLYVATQYAQSPVALSTITFPTQTQGAAGSFGGCWTVSVAATGASGTFWSVSPQAWSMALNSAPGTLVQAIDVTTAASSTIDLTKGIYLSVNAAETASHNITGPIINSLVIKPTATQ